MFKKLIILTLCLFLSACAENGAEGETSAEELASFLRGAAPQQDLSGEQLDLLEEMDPEKDEEMEKTDKDQIILGGQSVGAKGAWYAGRWGRVRFFTMSYGEANHYLGGHFLRNGTYRAVDSLYANSAASRFCGRNGLGNGGEVEWWNVRYSRITFVCFWGNRYSVGNYVFNSTGPYIDGQHFGPHHPLFTAAAVSRYSRTLHHSFVGGILQEYTPHRLTFTTVNRGKNIHFNIHWGATFGFPVLAPSHPHYYLWVDLLAGHVCRYYGEGAYGRVTENNGHTGAITVQCGR